MKRIVQLLVGSAILAVTMAAAAVPAKPTHVLNGIPDLPPVCDASNPCSPDVSNLEQTR